MIFLVLLSMIIVNALAEDKLQIGIKKKVENCDRKSKKGDRLHMHYTVIDEKLEEFSGIFLFFLGYFEVKWKKI